MNTIIRIINSPAIKPSKPPFEFKLTKEAAQKNFQTLKAHNMSLGAVIDASPFGSISYGSEFKPTNVLEPLFEHHPRWERMKNILEVGSDYHATPLEEHVRLGDLKGRLAYGNHKSAQGERAAILAEKMEKEVIRGWSIPLLPSHLPHIPDAEMTPMGLANQAGINERGEIVFKDRVTHDMSFDGERSLTSINGRVIDEFLAPLQYGFMFLRVIHYIVTCRLHFPTKRVLIRKDDFKSAYRRQHLSAKAAVQTITQILKDGVTFLLLALRLTFGGKPGPSEWCTISEPICDLANEILNCEEWDPSTLHSPHQHRIPTASTMDPSIPFAKARPMMVNVPLEPHGKCDQYIDDTATVGIDHDEESRKRLEAAMMLATFIVAREVAEDEGVIRDDIMSFEKMQAEGGLEETIMLLGWILDTRRLLVSLPENKYIAWIAQIDEILSSGRVTSDVLEQLIGRLNHAAAIIPLARHFLSRLRSLQLRAKNKWINLHVSATVRQDLELWKTILTKAKNGVSMNLLTFREPTHIYRSDACEYGLGGFNDRGRAWRWMIPERLRGRAHIGLLEFLGELVNLWIDIIEGEISEEDCALIMGDSTNAIGWVRKSNFMEDDENPSTDQPVKLRVARKLADMAIKNDIKIYSQWFPGEDNVIPDILSRDWHLSDSHLLELLTTLFPTQLHPNFNIAPIPKEIDSFLCSVLQDLPFNKQRLPTHKPSGYGLGGSGKTSCPPSALKAMSTWSHLLHGNGRSSSQPSVKPSDLETSRLTNEDKTLLETQSAIPSDLWLRPSGLLSAPTQD